MKTNRLFCAVCALLIAPISADAIPVPGQGTWETTLLPRDLNGNPATVEAYYDRVLDISWLADTLASGTRTRNEARAWAASLNVYGITGWRLPFIVETTGGTVYEGASVGYNALTTSGTPPYPATTVYSELATMFYDTLGNIGQFDSFESELAGGVPGWGLSNTGPFANLQPTFYWIGTEFSVHPLLAREFHFGNGHQGVTSRDARDYAWAVHDGDVGDVPEPSAAALLVIGVAFYSRHCRRRD
jgi:hypothetical protein